MTSSQSLNQPAIVIKFGGSLLEQVEFPSLVRGLRSRIHREFGFVGPLNSLSNNKGPVPDQKLDQTAIPEIHWIVGGGKVVDAVRHWDERLNLGQVLCHHLALNGMEISAKVFSAKTGIPLFSIDKKEWAKDLSAEEEIRGLELVESAIAGGLEDAEAAVNGDKVVNLGRFLSCHADRLIEIPQNWEVSSDSLALWYAQVFGAKRLVLAKSVAPLEEKIDLDKMTRLGWIDGFFHEFWESIRPKIDLSVVHLNTDQAPISNVEL